MAVNPTVKFISTNYLKENTLIEMNVDDSKLTTLIIKCQRIYLQQLLGSSFYDHLSVAVSGSTLTAVEESLIRNYVQPMVAEYVVYEALPSLTFKATNKAVVKQNSENSTPIDLDELKFFRASVRDMAEFMGERLSKYLCDNPSLFPEYQNPTLPENLSRNSRSYMSGVYIPKSGTNNLGIRSYNDPSDDCTDC